MAAKKTPEQMLAAYCKGEIDLKDSVFWHLHVSERTVEMIKQIEDEIGPDSTLGALRIAQAKVEVLKSILSEADLANEYRQWRADRGE